MAFEGKSSLIYQLYKEMVGATEKKEESRFSSNTNTLYANGKAKKSYDEPMQCKPTFYEIVVDKDDYNKLLKGTMKFWILEDNSLCVNDDLTIRESENFRQTGRLFSKRITFVARSSEFPGLKENYIAVGWE